VWFEWMSVQRDPEDTEHFSFRVLVFFIATLLALFSVAGAVISGAIGSAVFFLVLTVAFGWLTVRERRG